MYLRVLARVAFGYLAFVSIEIGVWALAAPRSFYNDFPGMGRAWVSIDGPYNEHLVRDVGALNLALAVVLVVAAVTLRRSMVVTAALAALVWGIPHLVYHVVRTDGYATSDLVISLGGLTLFVIIPIVILIGRDRFDPSVPTEPGAEPKTGDASIDRRVDAR